MYTDNQKLEMVESALWSGVSKKEGSKSVVEPNWVQSISPETPTVFLNGVYRCELGDENIENKITETINLYNHLKIPFRWKVTKSSRPTDLASRLEKHGLKHKETLYGLFADPKVHSGDMVYTLYRRHPLHFSEGSNRCKWVFFFFDRFYNNLSFVGA